MSKKKIFSLLFALVILIICIMPLASCSPTGDDLQDGDNSQDGDDLQGGDDLQNGDDSQDGTDDEDSTTEEEDMDSDDFLSFPVMTVDIDDGTALSEVNREEYVKTHISIKNTSNKFLQDNLPAEFKGRGNGSWVQEKKGYRIKYSSKQSLFGLPANKHWALFAAATDGSFLRNALAFEITNKVLDNIEYTSSVKFIDLYVNGDYHGVYQVFEHVRVDETRVNIDSQIGVLDTGYLLEYDAYAYAEGTAGINYFAVEGLKYPFTVKSPDPDDVTDENEEIFRLQVSYIQSYIQTVVNAALDGEFEQFSNLVDINSVVDMYIIHELFKNTDTGWSSFYMYKKPGDKLFFGPVWDFDLSAGQSRGDSSPYGLYVAEDVLLHSEFTSNEIFISLMKNSAFKGLVKQRWAVVSPQIPSVITNYVESVQPYADNFDRDKLRWGDNQWQTKQVEVKDWLLRRIAWLDEEWGM